MAVTSGMYYACAFQGTKEGVILLQKFLEKKRSLQYTSHADLGECQNYIDATISPVSLIDRTFCVRLGRVYHAR